MAASFTCDGCGSSVDVPMVVGHVVKRDYCEACAKSAEKYLEEENVERKTCAEEFRKKRQVLIDFYGKDGFKLPDVP